MNLPGVNCVAKGTGPVVRDAGLAAGRDRKRALAGESPERLRYFTAAEVCDRLRCSRKTLERRFKGKEIRHIRLTGEYLVREDWLYAYENNHTVLERGGSLVTEAVAVEPLAPEQFVRLCHEVARLLAEGNPS